MAKISNTVAYPNVQPTLDDYFVLSDQTDSLLTKTSKLSDVKNLFGIQTVTAHVTVQDVELINLGTTDVTLIAAPGSNKVLDIISFDVFMDVGNTPFNFINDSIVKLDGVNITTISSSTINSVTDKVVKQPLVLTNILLGVNKPLLLTNVGNATQGNGVLRINILYRELTTNNTF
tara:strand:+ start:7525 stop:8049 length:525 start_codon:yes stop_codon:yes gene_type:complete